MLKYPVVITHNKNTNKFFVQFCDIPDTISRGDSKEKALETALYILENALERNYFENNHPVPTPSRLEDITIEDVTNSSIEYLEIPESFEQKIVIHNKIIDDFTLLRYPVMVTPDYEEEAGHFAIQFPWMWEAVSYVYPDENIKNVANSLLETVFSEYKEKQECFPFLTAEEIQKIYPDMECFDVREELAKKIMSHNKKCLWNLWEMLN